MLPARPSFCSKNVKKRLRIFKPYVPDTFMIIVLTIIYDLFPYMCINMMLGLKGCFAPTEHHKYPKEKSVTMYANYHTHTIRCQHASGEDREYVEAAIRAGIKILGFSDHCPWVYPDGYASGIRMYPSDVDDYFYSLESLKKEYKNDIQLYIGFETEYIPELMKSQEKLLSGYPLDYMILGQHFLGTGAESAYTGTPTDDESVLEEYVRLVMEGVKTGKFLYVAHPDLIHYTGPDNIYEKHILRLCRFLKENDIPVEINALGASQGRHYPSGGFLRIAGQVGNSCIIGVDAHCPEQLLTLQGVDICEHLAEKFHLTLCRPPLGS